MIRKLLICSIPLVILFILTGSQMNDNGRSGRTGSPGESTCTSCHSSFTLNSGGGSISIQSPGTPGFQYTPGQTYSMSVTVSRTGNSMFGVDIEALTPANNNAGTLIITDAASTQIKTTTVTGISRVNIVHQLNGGLAPDSKVFIFDWTAPIAGTGNVTFYFTGIAANGNGNENSDYVYSSSQVFTEITCTTSPDQPGAISGNSAVCNGSGVIYSVLSVIGATSYTWALPSGWSGTSTNNSINAIASATSGAVTVIANNGCGSSLPSSLTVTGNPNTISALASYSDVTCNGSANGTASVTASGGTFPYTFSWTPSGSTSPSISGLTPGIYTVNITDASGCSNSASTTVSEPTPLTSSAGNSQSICLGRPATLGSSPTASGGTSPLVYNWQPSGSSDPNPIVSPTANTDYTLTVTDANNCTSTSSVSISINFAPVQPAFITGNSTVCNGATELYSVPSVSGATSYTWTVPSGWSGTSSTENINAIASSSSGTISVTADNSCGSSPASSLTVTVDTFTPVLTLSGDSIIATSGINYEWYLNGNLIGGAVDYFYMPIQNGNYYAIVTDANGCAGTSAPLNFSTVGIKNPASENFFTSYPNPAANRLNIIINYNNAISELNIIDVTGQKVKHAILQKGENSIDISGISEGYYHVIVGNENNRSGMQLLIAR